MTTHKGDPRTNPRELAISPSATQSSIDSALRVVKAEIHLDGCCYSGERVLVRIHSLDGRDSQATGFLAFSESPEAQGEALELRQELERLERNELPFAEVPEGSWCPALTLARRAPERLFARGVARLRGIPYVAGA